MNDGLLADMALTSSMGIRSSKVEDLQKVPAKWVVEPNNLECVQVAQERLNDLCALPFGWDGYEGLPVKNSTANFALSVLEKIADKDTPPPQIVPGFGGDLQMEWHLDNESIELHVRSSNDVIAWRGNEQNPDEDVEIELKTNFRKVAEWLKEAVR